MQYLQPSPDYALKLHRAGGRPAWHTRLALPDALAMASQAIAAEEAGGDPRYLTATVYRDAMVVSMTRYFPEDLRVKKNNFQPQEDD